MLPLLLSSCISNTDLKVLGKSDIDTVTDMHIRALNGHLVDIILLLYKHNPGELKKNPNITVEMRVNQVIYHSTDIVYPEINNLQQVHAIELGLSPDFRGDRVFALALGIGSMLRNSYNNLDEVFMLNQLEPQMLYDSARNLEVVLARLNNLPPDIGFSPGVEHSGTDSLNARMQRMVSLQDMMAQISANSSQRIINTLVRKATLIPIGGL